MASLNKVQLIGNVGRDPEIKTLNSGDRVANFSMAMSESWTDKSSGEKKERTDWVNIAVFNQGLVGIVEKYVSKGSKLYVEGKFSTRKYEKNGADHYVSECVLNNFDGKIVLLGDPKGAAQQTSGDYARRDAAPREQFSADLDDEIPF